jgi:hypothetical protein
MKQKKNKINCICANVLILSMYVPMYRCTDVRRVADWRVADWRVVLYGISTTHPLTWTI